MVFGWACAERGPSDGPLCWVSVHALAICHGNRTSILVLIERVAESACLALPPGGRSLG